tara:strand:- start:344 stop:556 length:213 start_codon:yes stop_codon:yes gene_type:complete
MHQLSVDKVATSALIPGQYVINPIIRKISSGVPNAGGKKQRQHYPITPAAPPDLKTITPYKQPEKCYIVR